MAQPSEAAVGEAVTTDSTAPAIEAPTTPKDAIDAIVDDWLPEEEQETGEAEPEGEAGLEGDPEAEPEAPAIEPPVSWTAEEKEAFKALPKDVQDVVSRRESEREKFVQSKAQEAKQAASQVERQALEHIAQLQRHTAEQLSQYAEQLTPAQPDPRLIATDPESYALQLQAYQHYTAQREQAQRQADHARAQEQAAMQEIQRREAEEFRQTLATTFPEYLEPSNAKLRENLGSIALELGYSQEQIQQARAPDILAMKKVMELKDKASKYDALMSKRMETVRSAKNLPPVAKPGTAQSPSQQNAAKRQSAWERTKANRNDSAAFADYLEASGIKL